MKKRLAIVLLGAAIALPTFSGVSYAANCSKSCTSLKNGCISRGGNAAACSSGFDSCLKTGTYGGMPSGKTWTNICKK
jgi:hypothetical protein